jgi:excisionase family DNA binding protein
MPDVHAAVDAEQVDRRQEWERVLDENPRSGTVNVEIAAEMLGLSRGTGYSAAKSGALPSIQMGKRVLVPKKVLRRLLGLDAA